MLCLLERHGSALNCIPPWEVRNEKERMAGKWPFWPVQLLKTLRRNPLPLGLRRVFIVEVKEEPRSRLHAMETENKEVGRR